MSTSQGRAIRAGQLSVDDIGKQIMVKVAEKTWVTGPLVNIHNAVLDKKTVVSVQINGVEGVSETSLGGRFYGYVPRPNFYLGLRDVVTVYDD